MYEGTGMNNVSVIREVGNSIYQNSTKSFIKTTSNKIVLPVNPIARKPLPQISENHQKYLSLETFLSQRSNETTFLNASASPTLSLVKAYSKGFEFAADTGMKTISGNSINNVNETVFLKKGITYTLNSAFGLNNIKGNAQLDVKDADGKVLKSVAGAVGKTSIKTAFTPTVDGIYSINITGQPIAKTTTAPASTTNLYQSYQFQVSQPLSILPNKSGNTNVDALVLAGTNAWQHAVGSAASASDNVIDGNLKSLNNVVDNSKTIEYAFMDSAFLSGLTGKDKSSPSVMDDKAKAAVVTAFDYLSSLINVKFTQSASTSDATIIFGENKQNGISAGYANPPNQSGDHQQYLFLASDAETNNSTTNNGFASGTYGWQTLIHEIAHTMGLKHPFNGNAGGGGTPGPYLPTSTNTQRFSIMSYATPTDSKALTTTISTKGVSVSPTQINPSTFMTYDIAALQYLYGANTATTSTDRKLSSIQTLDFTDAYKGMETIWTPNGGTLDASKTTNKNIIDLRGGAYSSINYLDTGVSQVTKSLSAQSIVDKKYVDSIMKTFNLSIAAAYTGKNNVALAYGSKITQVDGGSGEDNFYVSNYSSTIKGGGGTDTVFLTGVSTDWTVSDNSTLNTKGGNLSSAITVTNKSTKAAISLSGIEKYAFYSATSPAIRA
jgi:hypothetical protein